MAHFDHARAIDRLQQAGVTPDAAGATADVVHDAVAPMDRHVTREDLHRELRTLLFQIGDLGLALAGIIIGVMAALA